MPIVAKTAALPAQASNDHHVSLLQVDGSMAPISKEETTPAGNQRAMVSMVVSKIVECAKRPRATTKGILSDAQRADAKPLTRTKQMGRRDF